MIKVKLIKKENAASVVEYTAGDKVKRAIVPSDAVKNDSCESSVLQAGIDYGVNWQAIIGEIDTSKVAERLHKMGIWDWGDLQKKPLAIRQAVLSAAESNIQNALRELARIVKEGV